MIRTLIVLMLAAYCSQGVWATAPVAPENDDTPFKPGERLTYRLKYGIITAGYAVFEVHEHTLADGQPGLRFVLTARTQGLVDKLYRVRDLAESIVAADVSRSHIYRKQQKEGSHERDIEVIFDWAENLARYSNFGKARDPISIGENAVDPLSVFYRFRLSEIATGSEIELPVSDGKGFYETVLRVKGRETIVVEGKSYDTWYVEPDLKDLRGVFKKNNDAVLGIWFTADERRIPVKLSSKVAVGSFVGELVNMQTADGD